MLPSILHTPTATGCVCVATESSQAPQDGLGTKGGCEICGFVILMLSKVATVAVCLMTLGSGILLGFSSKMPKGVTVVVLFYA